MYFIIRHKFLVGELIEKLSLNIQCTRYISKEDKFNIDEQKQDFLCILGKLIEWDKILCWGIAIFLDTLMRKI